MSTALERYRAMARRRDRRATRSHTRLDIQGLRMVAVLTVFACHLWGWPPGGFVGVDVFFVISGFLITGNLLRSADASGTVSFKTFYWNRVRRILPAATLVLLLTYGAALLVFLPFRAEHVGVDALFAFIFLSNWRFAIEGTDYFTAGSSVSPLQHYWSLSIEEQFYFVWPAVIFAICAVVARKAWGRGTRMLLAGIVMAIVVGASFVWAVISTASNPTWAYFDTFTRVWELGVGALLASAVGTLARIPTIARPFLSWAGLILIGSSLFVIHEGAVGFPAPWSVLPVAGAALVIAAGVGTEPKFQSFLRNPISTYVGDISYSLYLFHWPVIVILGSVMSETVGYYVGVLALAFGLSIASYHFVENPLRRADGDKFRESLALARDRQFGVSPTNRYAAAAAIALVVLALTSYTFARDSSGVHASATEASGDLGLGPEIKLPLPGVGPVGAALQAEIAGALEVGEWPVLHPSLESVIANQGVNAETTACGNAAFPDPEKCTFGAADAPIRIVLTGDSIAMAYVGTLRDIALNSGGQIQLNVQAMNGCQFVSVQMANEDQSTVEACPARRQHTIDVINSVKPSIVIISNQYGRKIIDGTDEAMSDGQWASALQDIIEQFSNSVAKVVFMAPPPADVSISDCFGVRGNVPADCVSRIPGQWIDIAVAEKQLAEALGGAWVDSRTWLCVDGKCPSFVGETPTKQDQKHITNAYGLKIAPAMRESLQLAGVLPGP